MNYQNESKVPRGGGGGPFMYQWPEWARNNWQAYIILVTVRDIIFMWDLSSGRPPGWSIKDTIKEWGCNNWWAYVILEIVRDIIIMWDLSSGRPPGCTESQVLYFRRRSQFLQIDSIERYLTFSFLLCLTSLHPEMRDLIKSHIFFECLQRFYYTFLMVLISVWRIKMAKMFQ